MRASYAIKICGLKFEKNIREICALGPDLIGFVFAKSSPRYVEPGFVSSLALSKEFPLVGKVGVFVDETLGEVTRVTKVCNLQALQLHGIESPKYCEELKRQVPGVKLIKTFEIEPCTELLNITAPYEDKVDLFLFDSPKLKEGETVKKRISWNPLLKFPPKLKYILAGRLDSTCISKALNALLDTNLIGFDFSSKLENEPGLKCPDLCSHVIGTVRSIVASKQQLKIPSRSPFHL